ncbi:hypothetical protein F5Y04DRAFT_276417 [Hypomontagnella monticulosa]|nr:hypothetical protein F5Y04DRAFT_276417 [Hypomontagnella monticulosa]
MSNDNNGNGSSNDRRGSVTSAAFSNLFHRSNSTSTGNGNGRESVSSAAARDQRRRLSVTTIGLSGTSPNGAASTPFGLRRGSISTNNSDSIDESAVDDEESAKTGPTSPFARRMSFGAQAMRNLRGGTTSPGSTGRPSQQSRRISNGNTRAPPPTATGAPPASAATRRASTSQASHTLPYRTPSDMFSARADTGYNWSEQLRSRAESSVQGHRPTFGPRFGSPPRGGSGQHERAKSVSEMPAPPQQAASSSPTIHDPRSMFQP